MRWVALVCVLFSCGGEARTPERAPERPPTRSVGPRAPRESDPRQVESESESESDSHSDLEHAGGSSTSVGGPNDGSVTHAAALPSEGVGFRFNPRRDSIARFGTDEMIHALVDAAAITHRAVGGEVTINDLGLEHGGPIPHHGSHRAGRDVDVLFHLLDADDEPIPSVGAFLDPEGRGVDFLDLSDRDDDVPVHLDVPRTWRFVEALIQTSAEQGSPLQRIFLAEHLRTLLLAHAQEHGDEAATARFAELTCQPSYPHDDHFHFRFFCSAADIAEGCEDANPIYPWRMRELDEVGVTPRPHRPRRDRPMAPVTTPDAAEAAAGGMAPEPRAWLRRRREWMDTPHPGRRWCR